MGPQSPFVLERKRLPSSGQRPLRGTELESSSPLAPSPCTSASPHSPDSTTWKGQNGRTFKMGNFPASAVTLVDSGGSPASRLLPRGAPARGEHHQGNISG